MMAAPIRVHREWQEGWQMPENTVYVGRGSKWGNPFQGGPSKDEREYVKRLFVTLTERADKQDFIRQIRSELRGKNLACWCPLDHPCHADVLLEIANETEGE